MTKPSRPRPATTGSRPAAAADPSRLVTVEDYDWADRRTARSQRELEETAARLLEEHAHTPPRQRLDRLVLVRESDEYDRALLDGALRQACARNADAPRVADVLAAGLAPLYDRTFEGFEVVPYTEPRAVFFALGGVGWVLSQASAGSTTARGDNAFTSWFTDLLATQQPRVLDTIAFGRLVRSLDHGPGPSTPAALTLPSTDTTPAARRAPRPAARGEVRRQQDHRRVDEDRLSLGERVRALTR